jgi:hypothetical protein
VAAPEGVGLSHQAAALGGLGKETLRALRQPKGQMVHSLDGRPFEPRIPKTREGANLIAGAQLAREWNGKLERVMVLEKGFTWNGKSYGSLSRIAQGDDRHELERPSILRLADGEVRSLRRGRTPRPDQ